MRESSASRKDAPLQPDHDVVIVGAGFGGLYALHKIREAGFSVRLFEEGTGVGGTWYWNRYPGARVDVEVREYSYSFSEDLERGWRWNEHFASQPELLRYANHVADRFDLRRDIQFETRVIAMTFDAEQKLWHLRTDKGERVTARFCVMATGCLSVPKDIDIPGIGDFHGRVFRTSRWPKEGVDFTGERVAVIGTGSSGIQSIPEIAKQAKHLTVFQRTPNFSLPSRNKAMTQATFDDAIANRAVYRAKLREIGAVFLNFPEQSALAVSEEARRQAFDKAWEAGGFNLALTFTDLRSDKAANDTASEYVRERIREIVKDPAVAEKLLPTNHPFMTKRPCVDTGYFETYNRDNVALVDLNETPIETVTETGIRTTAALTEFDSIVLAIGFDAMTGALCNIDITGRDGAKLKDLWSSNPGAYLGLGVAGFPNMFAVTGPGSPSVLANMILGVEQHVEWITNCLTSLRERKVDTIEATRPAQDAWMAHVDELAAGTLYPLANSWYVGANVPGKKRAFTIYVGPWKAYCDKCDEVAANGYEGFRLGRAAVATEA